MRPTGEFWSRAGRKGGGRVAAWGLRGGPRGDAWGWGFRDPGGGHPRKAGGPEKGSAGKGSCQVRPEKDRGGGCHSHWAAELPAPEGTTAGAGGGGRCGFGPRWPGVAGF